MPFEYISLLPAATLPLTGAELVVMNQASATCTAPASAIGSGGSALAAPSIVQRYNSGRQFAGTTTWAMPAPAALNNVLLFLAVTYGGSVYPTWAPQFGIVYEGEQPGSGNSMFIADHLVTAADVTANSFAVTTTQLVDFEVYEIANFHSLTAAVNYGFASCVYSATTPALCFYLGTENGDAAGTTPTGWTQDSYMNYGSTSALMLSRTAILPAGTRDAIASNPWTGSAGCACATVIVT